MKSALFLMFFYAVNSFAGFTCNGVKLVGSGYGVVSYYKTNEACQFAVKSSMNELTCNEEKLIGSGTGIVTWYSSSDECWRAVRSSK